MTDRSNVYIGTGMCCDTEETASLYGQVSGRSSSPQFQAVYWKCVVVFFASSVRNNPEAHHLLFTNVDQLPRLGQFDMEQFLTQMGVEIVTIPFTYVPPKGFFGTWNSTFYKFDVLRYFAKNSEANRQYMNLDSDCIWVNSVDRLSHAIDRDGVINYDLNLEADDEINGWSRTDLKTIYPQLGIQELPDAPHYYGAELIAANSENIQKLADEIDAIWKTSLARFQAEQPKFNTEEQMLSFAYYKLGCATGSANPYIKRIWTSPRFHNTCEEDLSLDIWHLPSEKRYGIKRLFEQVINPKSQFWQLLLGKPLTQYTARYLGLPKPTLTKRLLDTLDDKQAGLAKRITKFK